MADSQYTYMVQAILNYYSSGSDIWQKVNTGSATPAEIFNAFSYIPQVKIDRGIGGNVLGISYADPLSKLQVVQSEQDIIDSMNSNSLGGSYGGRGFNGNIPADFGYDDSTGQYFIRSGSKSSLGATLSTVADRASLAVTGVNIGCKLGKFIDQTLYDLAPDFWDEHLPTINPATWNTLCGQSDVGDFFLRVLFDVTPNGTTGYIPEEVLAYYYQMFRDLGLYDPSGSKTLTVNDPTVGTNTMIHYPVYTNPYFVSRYLSSESQPMPHSAQVISGNVDFVICSRTYYRSVQWTFFSRTPFTLSESLRGPSTSPYTVRSSETRLIQGYPIHYYQLDSYDSSFSPTPISVISPYTDYMIPQMMSNGQGTINEVGHILLYQSTITETGQIQGITDIPNSTQYPPTNITGTTTPQVLSELKQQYPDLFANPIKEKTLQDDGTIKETTYIPIPWAVDGIREDTATTTDDATQDNTIVNPETMEKIIEDNPGPTTPDTGDGNGPTPVIPVGQASSLWAVYHPSQSILNSFGAWLWSSDLVEQIKRLFFDPMQGVIGVHKVFSPVPTGGNQNIKVGYIDSGISCPTVSSQYTQVDCGTVSVDEIFGNVFDYEPFTQISAYLPFIGVVKLSTADVMRSKVNITYGVDVITGACLAKIKVTRDGSGGILYSFGGSCAVHYPLSSGSYGGIISGIVSAAVGIGTSVMTGNPLAAIGGVVAGINQAHLDVSKSGGFTGASGATGPKKPYLIISRPQIAMARNFDVMTGYPANNTVRVKDCEGFIKCKEAHIESSTATKDEVTMIESILKNGILI